MNREIRFKAWTGDKMQYSDDLGWSFWGDCIMPNYHEGLCEWPLMQYTGLKDKNEKEVYEGDIVNLPIDGEMFVTEIKFTVDRDFNGWGITPQHVEDGAEVIGNIHEHPDLIN